MKLPHADRLENPGAKVVQYLLSPTHRAGRGKAGFFAACGFQVSAWDVLAGAAICDRLSLEREDAMIQELEDVISECLPKHGLRRGDISTVVLVHRGGKGYEVEFTALDGEAVAVVTLLAAQVRPAHKREIAHARELAGSAS